MGSFTNGALVGLGISLLFAPMKGEDMRHLIAERAREIGRSSSNNQDRQQLGTRVEEVRQQVSSTPPTGTASQPTGGITYSTPTTAGSATQQTGTARPAGPAGPAERPQSPGTTMPQTGPGSPGSRPNRTTK